jgi:hypothetical protein
MLPPQFYIYCLLPEFVWWAVARHWNSLMTAISRVRSSLGLQKLLMLFMFHVIGIEILVSNVSIYSLHVVEQLPKHLTRVQ